MFGMHKKTGSSIVQYAVTAVIVATVLFAMTTYIKRGVQARIKDMADGFIGDGKEMQAADTGVFSTSSSNTSSGYNGTVLSRDLLGGGSNVSLNDRTSMNASSKTVDFRSVLDKEPSASPDVVSTYETKQYEQGGGQQ